MPRFVSNPEQVANNPSKPLLGSSGQHRRVVIGTQSQNVLPLVRGGTQSALWASGRDSFQSQSSGTGEVCHDWSRPKIRCTTTLYRRTPYLVVSCVSSEIIGDRGVWPHGTSRRYQKLRGVAFRYVHNMSRADTSKGSALQTSAGPGRRRVEQIAASAKRSSAEWGATPVGRMMVITRRPGAVCKADVRRASAQCRTVTRQEPA